MYSCVLFDIDNTLLLKKPTIAEKVFELAVEHKPALQMDDVEKAYAASELWQGAQIKKENETGVRMSDGEYLQNVCAVYQRALGLDEETGTKLTGVFTQNYRKEYQLMPGAWSVLSQLRDAGVKLGIVSNNQTSVRKALEEKGLTGFFECIVISEEVGLYKPDPEILRFACEKLEASCAGSLYVGDHPFDVLCAHSAGMAALWLPANRFMEMPDYIGAPEFTVSSFQEAGDILLGKK